MATGTSELPNQDTPPSLLLDLPVELQIAIYEFAILSSKEEIQLLNFACNSSYRHRGGQMAIDEKLWASGNLHAPFQPPLTRTCSFIRDITLPMFYQEHTFHAHYCYGANLEGATRWLTAIGARNRSRLRKMFLFDRNSHHDRSSPKNIAEAMETFKELFDAEVEEGTKQEGVWHRVIFPRVED
ncbi:hypothetical protein LTR17_007799 [Elasticomyces elasticus]|nr:hypothetical protein LTR17_007799 [Elasticomyces elasticus]